MKLFHAAVIAATVASLAACAPNRSMGSSGASATPPAATQSGAGELWHNDVNTGAGSP